MNADADMKKTRTITWPDSVKWAWAAAAILLARCAAEMVPELLPPTDAPTVEAGACARGAECGFVHDAELCILCLRHYEMQLKQDGIILSDLPSPDKIDCVTLEKFAIEKRVVECIDEQWYKP